MKDMTENEKKEFEEFLKWKEEKAKLTASTDTEKSSEILVEVEDANEEKDVVPQTDTVPKSDSDKDSSNTGLYVFAAVFAMSMLIVVFLYAYEDIKQKSLSGNYATANVEVDSFEEPIPIEDRIKAVESVDEARDLLNGTTWHYTENLSTSGVGGWIKVVFDKDTYTTYYAQPSDGKWTVGGEGTYQLEEGRYSNTGEKYIAVKWEGDMQIEFLTIPCQFSMTLDTFQLNVRSSLIDGVANMNDRINGMSYQYSARRKKTNLVGKMEFGDYEWN